MRMNSHTLKSEGLGREREEGSEALNGWHLGPICRSNSLNGHKMIIQYNLAIYMAMHYKE